VQSWFFNFAELLIIIRCRYSVLEQVTVTGQLSLIVNRFLYSVDKEQKKEEI